MGTTRDMAGALNFRSGLLPIEDIGYDEKMAMDPLTAKGSKIEKNMEKEYGEKKGKSVFYASKNAGKISGVDGGPGSGPQNGGGKKSGFRMTGGGKPSSEMSETERKEHDKKLSDMSPEEMKQHLFVRHGYRADDCAAEEMMTRDAMTNEEMEKWEKEKEEAHNMAPKIETAGKGRFGGRASEKAGSRDFTRKDEYNEAGT